jgi:hypothetical protein
MLYDPKWEKPAVKTKSKVLSLAGLIAWLERQNPQGRYRYSANGDCLIARYLRSHGWRGLNVGPDSFDGIRWFLFPVISKSYPKEMDQVANSSPQTYGAALERARNCL